ncbi:MAG: homoserine dehydrogenase [Halobaculum sp.]
MRLAVIGAGAVGSNVARLAADHGHSVVALADSSSAVVADTSSVTDSSSAAAGIDVEAALARKRRGEGLGPADPADALAAAYDALIEATPTTLGDAEPGWSHVEHALARDKHVVLANKGPVAERYADLRAAERESGGRVAMEATVAGAIPVHATLSDLGPASVAAVRGVLNGTANFVLSRMATEGLAYDHVLAEAQDLGVAEADPSFDVNGTDAALKCVILANRLLDARTDDPALLRERAFSLADAAVEGIGDVPGGALQLAREDGRTVRLVGEATPERVRVGPRLVPEGSPLAVSGTRNVVEIDADHAGELALSGKGAGGEATASAVLADVNRLAREH